jgi:hypothetical protein
MGKSIHFLPFPMAINPANRKLYPLAPAIYSVSPTIQKSSSIPTSKPAQNECPFTTRSRIHPSTKDIAPSFSNSIFIG